MLPISFFARVLTFGILLHLYVGIRLTSAAPAGSWVTWFAVVFLLVSLVLIPLGMSARRIVRQPLSDRIAWAGLSAMGFFSSLLALTVLRDVVLIAANIGAWVTGNAQTIAPLTVYSARTGTAMAL